MHQCSIREVAPLLALITWTACSAPTSQAAPGPSAAPTSQGGASGDADALAPGKRPQAGVTANCTPWASAQRGAHRYVNDQWGSNKAQGRFEQCLLTRVVGDQVEVGWTWSWPGADPSVFAYPSATFGWKPWAGGQSTDPRLPMKLVDIEQLVLDYAVETEAEGSFNLAPEVWLTHGKNSSPKADPTLITSEIMFWMEYAGEAVPAGRPIGTILIAGDPYELWEDANMGKDANGVGWKLLTIKSAQTRRRGSIPLHDVLKQLVQRGSLAGTEYLASIEFGNELMGGTGTTWVHELAVDLR